jgi:signal transduction histidine kinase
MELQAPLYRRLIPWIMVIAYLSVTVIAGYYVFEIRNTQRAQVTDQLESALQDQVAAWEEELESQLSEWMDNASTTPDRGSVRQRRLRDREPWFDALYMWARQREVSLTDRMRPSPPVSTMIFPRPVQDDRQLLMARMCLIRARIQASDPTSNPEDIARQYVYGCRHEPLTVRLIAATEAAEILKDHGLQEKALAVLNTTGLPDELTLVAAARQDIHPLGIVAFHFQRAEILLALNEVEKAMALYYRVGTQICQLDAPDAQLLLPSVQYPIIAQLRRHKKREEAARMEMQQQRLERRVAGFTEIDKRILPAPRIAATEMPRWVYDQYSEPPYLLYYGCCYGFSAWGQVGIALQLDQAKLIEDFLATKSIQRVKWITVTDASGAWVRGIRRGGPIAFRVPFTRTLTHLRVGVREDAITARLERMEDQWVAPLVVIVICFILGCSALIVQVRASWKQRELLKRQREFTTRVTHELKTPLAGIRIMAENLELGAFKDRAQLQHMAGLILDETDRLTARVDEVLDAARERTIPHPEPFDPEEAVLEAIDTWGPRLENAGVRLSADLHATPEVTGDLRALRDAIGCLLDNALKYRREDGDDSSVWLELSTVNPGLIQIVVTDNGIGVPSNMRTSIFNRFVRVEGPNRGKGGGHGLGLAQVAATIRSHHGTISCTDGVDGGARFIVQLPAA